MKNRIFMGISYLAAAVLLGAGPSILFPVCPVTPEKIMKCHWSAQAEIAVAVVLAVIGLAVLFCKSPEGRRMLNLCGAGAGVSAILIPASLIGYCAKPEMACRMLTFPVVYAVAVIVILASAVSFFWLTKHPGEAEV